MRSFSTTLLFLAGILGSTLAQAQTAQSASAEAVAGRAYAPVERAAASQAKIVAFRDPYNVFDNAAPAMVYVNGLAQISLERNGFTIFCVKPGQHSIDAVSSKAPSKPEKVAVGKRYNFAGGETHFMKVRDQLAEAPVALFDVPREIAERELAGSQRAETAFNGSPVVEPCIPTTVVAAPVAPAEADFLRGKEIAPGRVADQRLTMAADALFAFNQSHADGITDSGRSDLAKLASDIRVRFVSVERIRVTGHTDQIGGDAYNDQLSRARAETVKRLLVSFGIPDYVILTAGKGKREPVKTDCRQNRREAQIACFAPNRRVEVEVFGTRRP